MQISIVIVNFNTVEMLRDCLFSVYSGLKGDRAELIVVDNGSTDGSPEMIEVTFPNTILIRNNYNRGFAAANNQAIRIATGKYILMLNSDTIIHGDVIQRSAEYLENNVDVGIMGCRVLNADGTLQPTCSQFPTFLNLFLLTSGLSKLSWLGFFDRYQMRRWNRSDEREVDVVSGCYMMVRAEAINKIGLLDEGFFFFGEETDWCRRMQRAGWRLRFAPVGQITHLGGGTVRRLSYKRDLMLSSAMVRLHLRHGGIFSAVAVWLMLFGFNLSRAVYWTGKSAICGGQGARERRSHFWSIVRHYGRVWPDERTYAS